jgi:hypothetical protein
MLCKICGFHGGDYEECRFLRCYAALITTDVSEEPSASIIRMTRINEQGTTLAVTSNRRTLRRNSTSSPRRRRSKQSSLFLGNKVVSGSKAQKLSPDRDECYRKMQTTSSCRSVRRLLVTANVVPSSPILVSLMMEALGSSETSAVIRAPRRNVAENDILHSYRHENHKSYIALTGWTL